MLTPNEKNKIKDVISEGLNINPNINFPYFLNAIGDTNDKVKELDSRIQQVVNNQDRIERKLDRIINLICEK